MMVMIWWLCGDKMVIYTLVMTKSLLLKMAIEIVDFAIEHGDFP